ncbi:hypothetical protein MSAR_40900 [Mycolicibacterium sarraceniae]|uniref:Uncharacterized protein n=1 Tax=Mycolicibacterium sarraceniae TaxID=1534348 RepID=A0A7I7SVA8_9MYCO|nr:hypothetical protein MSAR_40900 [Mycolicibacterium sarraceniae]
MLELLADEEEPEVAAGSAWARPEPLMSAAPNPTVNAEFATHVGTAWAPC